MEYTSAIIRAAIAFVVLWAVARVLGHKQIGQLTLFDYITGITIGSLTAALVVEEHWPPLLLGIGTWTLLAVLMDLLNLKGRTLHRLTDATPIILIRNGQILEKGLRRARMNVQQLTSLLRQAGYFTTQEVEFAILETGGALSVLPKSQYRPVQPRDLGLSTAYEGLPIQVMHEGRHIPVALNQAGLSEEWLLGELAKQQAAPEEVFAAWLDSQGQLLVHRFHQPQP